MNLQSINFNNDKLDIIKINSNIYISIRKVCNNLGIDFKFQHQKLKNDPTFESKLIEVQTNGGVQKVFCIPLEKLNGWLFTINPNRVKPEVKQKLITYKKECFDVLFNHFIKKAQPTQPQLIEDNCQIEELIKRSDIVRGYQGQIAKLENELAKKQSEIKNLELQTNNPFEMPLIKEYIEVLKEKEKQANKIPQIEEIFINFIVDIDNKLNEMRVLAQHHYQKLKIVSK